MKRILALTLCAILLLFAGCDAPAEPSAPTQEQLSTQPTEQTQPSTEPTQETIQPDPMEPTEHEPAPNPFEPWDFAYVDGYLTCTAAPAMLGVDVSKYQGDIDWQKVAGAGVEFAMIRIGNRGYGAAGKISLDAYALDNIAQAQAAGLQVGVYFYSQALNEAEAIEEAEFVLDALTGIRLQLPVTFDWEVFENGETKGRTYGMKVEEVTPCAVAFCETIRAAGRQAMVYFNPEMAMDLLYLEQLTDYGFWLAQYGDAMAFPYKVDMWQYTSAGKVDGIGGKVDLNLCFLPNG